MPEELDGVFEAAFQKAFNFLSERRFNRELRQEQKSSVKQLFPGGDLLLFSPQDFEKAFFSTLSTCKRRPCCPCNLSIEKYCKRSNQGGLFDGDFGWLVV